MSTKNYNESEALMAGAIAVDATAQRLPADIPERRSIAQLKADLDNVKTSMRSASGWKLDAYAHEARELSDAIASALEDITSDRHAVGPVSLRSALLRSLDAEKGTGFTWAVRSLTVGTDAKGGNTVKSIGHLPEVHDAISGHDGGILGAVRSIVTPMGTSTPGLTIATITAEAVGDDYTEEEQLVTADVTFAKVEVAAAKRSVISKLSRELVEDSVVDAEQIVVEAQRRGHTKKSEAAIVAAVLADTDVLSTDAAPTLASIQQAVGQVLAAGFTPTHVFLAPADWTSLRTTAGINADKVADALGVIPVVSSALSTGEAIVADAQRIAFVRRDLVPVNISTSADFLSDLITVRTTIRSGVGILVPDAISVVKDVTP